MSPEHAAEAADQAALRADIRRLGNLLGESLVRQEGQELLDLVERVRLLSRGDRAPTGARRLLEGVDLDTAARLVRAFGTYFHLANVTEQVHRARAMRGERRGQGRLAGADAPSASAPPSMPADEVPRARRAGSPCDPCSPPTRPRRPGGRSCPSAAGWPSCSTPGRPGSTTRAPTGGSPRSSTCCGRPTSCGWTGRSRSTRRATRPTTSTSCMLHTVADVLEELADELAALGVELPPSARPLRFGSWIGGDRDGNPNVTPRGHQRRARAPARARASATCAMLVDDLLRGPLVVGAAWSARATSCWRASSATSPRCPSSTRASAGSTPTSPTGSRAAASSVKLAHTRDADRARAPAPARSRLPRHRPSCSTTSG